jgi:hypothetical protein
MKRVLEFAFYLFLGLQAGGILLVIIGGMLNNVTVIEIGLITAAPCIVVVLLFAVVFMALAVLAMPFVLVIELLVVPLDGYLTWRRKRQANKISGDDMNSQPPLFGT